MPCHDAASCLGEVSQFWFDNKMFFGRLVGVSHDSLHVLIGVCVQFAAAAVLRVSVKRPGPWLIVFGLEFLNECSDWHLQGTQVPLQMAMGESGKDIAMTMILPTLILILARLRPKLFA